jgi:hypothetical protein
MGINTNYSAVPIQKLPLTKKTKPWRESNIDAFIGKATNASVNGKSEAEDLRIKYDLYNGKFDVRDIEYVVDPFKVGDSLPASPQNFNIIRPKIDLLIGEESKRPENIKVLSTGDSGAGKAEQVELELLMQYVMSKLGEQPQEGQEPQTPEQIEKYMQYEYSDIAEKTGYYALKYLKENLNTPNEFLKGWKDALIAGKEIHYVGRVNGEPHMERVNTIGFSFDKSPDVEFIEKGDYAVRHMSMTPGAIHDRFYSSLTNGQLDTLIEMTGGGRTKFNKAGQVNYDKVLYKESIDLGTYGNGSDQGTSYLDVYHVTWRSMKKLGFLTYIDEEGEEVEITVDETYRVSPDETIEWQWVGEIWEGYKIGDDIYLDIKPIESQEFSLEHPNECNLPYIGAVYSDDNSQYTSMIDVMRPLQYMYIIIWFRLEVALARDKGRVLTMDITQIPKSMGIDVSKWMHYLSTLGVNLVNPYEEGWDIPGRQGGQAASFNQISSLDLSMSKVIADYIQLMDKLEGMIGEMVGVSKQRQGSIASNELVGNVERSVIQSSHITEPLFWKHNQVKKRVYAALLREAKTAWADSNQKKLHFIMDDTSRAFINIDEDFLLADLGIFMSDSSKEDRDIQALKNLGQAAVQGGASLSEVAELATSDNVTIMKNKLKEIDARKQELDQQAQQQQQEVQMAQIKSAEQMKAEENRIKEEDSMRKAETQIEVAYIQADAQQEEGDGTDYNKIAIDREKVNLQREKQNTDETLAQSKLSEEQRKNRVQESIKRSELEIKRKVANKPTPNTNK